MKKIFFSLLTLFILLFIFYLAFHRTANETSPSIENNQIANSKSTTSSTPLISDNNTGTTTAKTADFVSPLDRPKDRITKKTFGMYITPKTSPVQPERFMGYHTGVDFEIFPNELNSEVPVRAVCSGKLVLKKTASGYGGVAVEECILNKEPITIIYGHLKLASVNKKSGDIIKAGEVLGVLGADKSAETDGERKHLHLGFHKGTAINIRGYVSIKSDLSGWLDPCLFICNN
jgi:murein DD-endopeptidase MepM/ murein hydrolase activator NlpD